MTRQTQFSIYGDGPVDPDLGHPCGCQDIAHITLLPGFLVVRTEWLEALEALAESQALRIKQLENKK
jgi:hypothetical protein